MVSQRKIIKTLQRKNATFAVANIRIKQKTPNGNFPVGYFHTQNMQDVVPLLCLNKGTIIHIREYTRGKR